MLLAHAIRNNAVSLVDAQTTYKQNVVAVNIAVASVLSSNLPNLNSPPDDWNDYTIAYEQAKGDALDWVNKVLYRLLHVPDNVMSYNSDISQLLQDAKTQATTLVGDPHNAMALNELNKALDFLPTYFNMVTTFISNTLTSIKGFQDKLPDMAVRLQTIANKATADANADQTQIDKLNNDISQLRDHIKSLTTAIVLLGVVDAVALTVGTVVTIAAWPVGALAWFALGPAIAAASVVIALDAGEIKSDTAQIKKDQGLMTGITADVATLHVLAKNFGDMATQAQAIQDNLQAVLQEWQTLEDDVNTAVTDIRTATADTSSSNFAAVLDDVNGAIAEWNAAYAQAGGLHLVLEANTAPLQFGMSSDQVTAAMATGQTMDIIDYYNSLGNSQAA